jgi:hypothetical protein
VVASARSTEDIGYNLAEFLDELNARSKAGESGAKLLARIRAEPTPTGVAVQDAYLAAVAAHLAGSWRRPAPRWTRKRNRRLHRPWFALPYAWARAELLRSAPAAFRERNLFTTEDALRRV